MSAWVRQWTRLSLEDYRVTVERQVLCVRDNNVRLMKLLMMLFRCYNGF